MTIMGFAAMREGGAAVGFVGGWKTQDPGVAPDACEKQKAAFRVDGVDDRAMGVALDGKTLYCIAGRSLYALDVSDPLAPKVIGRLDGMDNRRQVAVADGFA